MRGIRAAAVALLGALLLLEAAVRLLSASGRFLGLPLLPLDLAAPVRAARSLDFSQAYLVFDPDLGWTVGPSRRSRNGRYRSTAEGARAGVGDDPRPGEEARALAFGDSFTHGDDVPTEAAWPARLRARGAAVVNLGVPGYGVDQALLRYRRLRGVWRTHRVLIGFMADNIGRHVSRYRPFMAPEEPLFFAKPRFALRGGALQLLPQPFAHLEDYFAPEAPERLRGLGAADAFYDPARYAPHPLDRSRLFRVIRSLAVQRRVVGAPWRALYQDPEATALTRAIVESFAREVRLDGRRPLVVFFPDATLARDALAGRASLAQPILESLRGGGLEVLDLTPALRGFLAGRRIQDHFIPHYSPELNAVVAEAVAPAL